MWAIATRGEFYSAYTPYQAEASQGTLQLIYEYQSMMCALTGMEVSNASLYDGASALAEAALTAVRANRGSASRRMLVPRTVNPRYLQVAEAIAGNQGLVFETVDYDPRSGRTLGESLRRHDGQDLAALVIQQPNFFGVLEEVDELTDWARENKALVIAVVNPISLALLKAPGHWGRPIDGKQGADIVCGEGQPLGVPLSSGGPYFGFMTTRMQYVRQMPGRIVGRTLDTQGKPGFTLTLQAREQHIRRSKANSNICTNQGLTVTAATIYMSLLGAEGLGRVAERCISRTRALVAALCADARGSYGIHRAPVPRGGAHARPARGTRAGGAGVARHPRRSRFIGALSGIGPRAAGLRDRNQDRRGPCRICRGPVGTHANAAHAARRSVKDRDMQHSATPEPIIFEFGRPGRRALAQFPPAAEGGGTVSQEAARVAGAATSADLPAHMRRRSPPGLPDVSELQAVRHFTRLSQLNFSIDTHFYPLGSCTMKYNPKACNTYAMLPELLGRHPLAPESHSQGFLACMYELQEMLKAITGMQGVSLTPMAGAQGEFAGVAMIRAYHRARGDLARTEIIVPRGGARHQSGDRDHVRLHGAGNTLRCQRRRRHRRTARRGRPIHRRNHAHQSVDAGRVRTENRRRSRRSCTMRAACSTTTARTSTPFSARCGPATWVSTSST